MTKQEVRAAALAKLAVRPTDTLWDVGAGTGSVSVELALAAPRGRVYAVECDPEACALIRKNRERFAAWNLTLIEGKAPRRWKLCPPRTPFSSAAPRAAWRPWWTLCWPKPAGPPLHLRHRAGNAERRRCGPDGAGLTAEVTQIAVSRTKPAGRLHLLMANNPIFLITGERK